MNSFVHEKSKSITVISEILQNHKQLFQVEETEPATTNFTENYG